MNRAAARWQAASAAAVACALFAPPQSSRAADEPLAPARYTIKQDEPTTGSMVPRRLVTGSVLPLNRRWHELTAEERRLFRTHYESMPETDEPPFPMNGLEPILRAIAKVQAALHIAEGAVTMEVDVDSRGEATAVRVAGSPDPQLTQALASVLMLTRYKPAVCAARPCRMAVPIDITFRIER
jgi:outer membrane biosynthesis protein TonB